jgi:hypothetical protein
MALVDRGLPFPTQLQGRLPTSPLGVGHCACESRGASALFGSEQAQLNLPPRRPHIKHARDVPPQLMAKLTNEQRRALRLLARSPNGCTEAIMLAHGFESAMLDKLTLDGLARVEVHDMRVAGRRAKVVWLQITPAGRKAIAE